MDERKAPRKRREKIDIELMDPTYKTAILDGYALAIQKLGQKRRDKILERLIRN